MNGIPLRRAVAVLFFLICSPLCSAQNSSPAPGLPDSSRQFGLIFNIQAAPHISSVNSDGGRGYAISLGFGVNFSPMFQMTIQVYTGKEEIPSGSVKPVDGLLPLGGGALEATLFFTSRSAVRPFMSAGYGLYTLNGGSGYNGGGANVEAGIEWDFSRYFSIRGGAQFAFIRYHDPTGEGEQFSGFEPFTVRFAGAAIRCAFYPSVIP